MPTLSKLVRDHIPEIITKDNRHPVTHIASDAEYWEYLQQKLSEESAEVFEDENIAEELADVLEVLHAIARHKSIDFSGVELLRSQKRESRGGFEQKIILDEIQ